jgi:hypothetical protein
MTAAAKPTLQSDDRTNASVAAVIDPDELEEARQDPRVRRFLADAEAYVAELEAEGRSL